MTPRIYHVCFSKSRLALPAGLLTVLLAWMATPEAPEAAKGRASEAVLLTAGFGKGSKRNLGWRGSYDTVPSSGAHAAGASAGTEPEAGFKRPSLFRLSAHREDEAKRAAEAKEIIVKKSSAQYAVDFNKSHSRWKYLSRSVRKQIDEASISRNRWKYLVIHNSATERGNARVFDYYHRNVKGMSEGLAYHFVIGNGSYSGNGEVEVGDRWDRQLAGGHVQSDSQNEVAIGICLVGDFDKSRVRSEQLDALDELMDYLQGKIGVLKVTTHRQVNTRPTTCPGRYFPHAILAKYESGGGVEEHQAIVGKANYPLLTSVERYEPLVPLTGKASGAGRAFDWMDFTRGVSGDRTWPR
jgi:hypothetical protein